MAGIYVQFPGDELSGTVDQIAAKLRQAQQEILEPVGVLILSLVQEAYVEKSSGQTGDDGITWAPIQLGTLLARMRRAGQLKSVAARGDGVPEGIPVRRRQKKIDQVAKTNKHNQDLFDRLAGAGVSFRDKKTGKEVDASRRTRKGTFLSIANGKSLKSPVSVSGYQIGVDTGLQRASGSPQAPSNVFVVSQSDLTVRVGYGMKYSDHFDEKRKLIPDVLPDEWMAQIQDLVSSRCSAVVTQVIDEKGLGKS